MSLRRAIEVIAELAERRVVGNYAIAGAVAALYHIQPTLTEDLDILVSVDSFEKHGSGLLLLGPIEIALAEMGYAERTAVGTKIEGWPVQFLPVASPLDEEALQQAEEVGIEGSDGSVFAARCMRAEHVMAVALKVGRPKDIARIQSFLEQRAVDMMCLKGVLLRHNLMVLWKEVCVRAGILDPFAGSD